jgi:hypothetical protein
VRSKVLTSRMMAATSSDSDSGVSVATRAEIAAESETKVMGTEIVSIDIDCSKRKGHRGRMPWAVMRDRIVLGRCPLYPYCDEMTSYEEPLVLLNKLTVFALG